MIPLSNYVLHWIEYALESKFLQSVVYFVKIRQTKNNPALIVPFNSVVVCDLIFPQHFLQNAPSMDSTVVQHPALHLQMRSIFR